MNLLLLAQERPAKALRVIGTALWVAESLDLAARILDCSTADLLRAMVVIDEANNCSHVRTDVRGQVSLSLIHI